MAHKGVGFEAEKWYDVAKNAPVCVVSAADMEMHEGKAENATVLPEWMMAEMLCYRVRYFSAGTVIGCKAFVNEAFTKARERFSAKRKDGARRLIGNAAAAKGRIVHGSQERHCATLMKLEASCRGLMQTTINQGSNIQV